jgi:hypothetical protein
VSDTQREHEPAANAEAVEAALVLAFAPVHKTALGAAVGVTLGALVLAVTLFHLLARPARAPELGLLVQYFYGYSVSWHGALVGAFWGGGVGFVAGWFLAFLRNFTAASWLFIIRTRAELQQTRDFLDHI